MSGLFCVIDGVDINGLRYTINYLSKKFETDVKIITFNNEDENFLLASNVQNAIDQLHQYKPDIVITNHLHSVPLLVKNFETIIWLNDHMGASCLRRQENVAFWRQSMGLLKSTNQQIYTSSQFISRQILEAYRVPSRVLYPYVPENTETTTPDTIFYNESPVYLNKLKEYVPELQFEKIKSHDDFKRAKLYIHVASGVEYSNIEIPVAASYGVPCIVENLGCLSEYITNGDKLLPLGSDEKQWLLAFKYALRDRDINSQMVKKLSLRYNHMSEIEEKIKRALQKNNKVVRPPSFQEAQNIAAKRFGSPRPIIASRPEKKQPIKPVNIGNGLPKNEVDHVKEYLSVNDNVYFGCGGLGDAILTISICWNNPSAKVIFGANHDSVKLLFESFKIPSLITRNFYPSVLGISLHNYIVSHHNFKGAAHIPDSMNYGEWLTNSDKYLGRINRSIPVLDLFGKMINPRATKYVVGIAPRGSDHNNYNKQRFLSVEEFRKFVKKFLEKDATVYAFGSPTDVDYYGMPQHNNFIWMTSDFGVSHPAPRYPTSFKHLLSCVNSCDELYSVDTWMKTYGALAGINTKVIMSRRSGVTIPPPIDSSDYIFMNKGYWGFDLVDIEQLIA